MLTNTQVHKFINHMHTFTIKMLFKLSKYKSSHEIKVVGEMIELKKWIIRDVKRRVEI